MNDANRYYYAAAELQLKAIKLTNHRILNRRQRSERRLAGNSIADHALLSRTRSAACSSRIDLLDSRILNSFKEFGIAHARHGYASRRKYWANSSSNVRV